MAIWAEAGLFLWFVGLVYLLVSRGLGVRLPKTDSRGRCRLHRWTRTEGGFLCTACGWRCEAGGDSQRDPSLLEPP